MTGEFATYLWDFSTIFYLFDISKDILGWWSYFYSFNFLSSKIFWLNNKRTVS